MAGLAAASIPLAFIVAPTAAFAAGETLEVVIDQVDGTPTFDATDGAGLDSSDSNGVIRTNDLITYNVEVRVEGGTATNTTFSMLLPLGYELDALPAVCTGPGSSLAPASLGDPVLPVTATSYQSLPQQTLTCDVGTRTAGSTFTYPITAKVRSEVPNGTASGDVVAQAVSDFVTTPAVSEPVSSVVSSAPKWDLSKNSTALQPDSGYFYTSTGPCYFDNTRICADFSFSILLSSENGGKGSSPLAGPITFTDNLTPDALYPAGTTSSAAWVAAGSGAMDKYGARLRACADDSAFNAPGPGIGQAAYGGYGIGTDTNAVRDSGSILCSQPGGPGTPATVIITDSDTTLATYPSEVFFPEGATLPGDRAYAVSQVLTMTVPLDAIKDFGINDGPTQSLTMKNTFEDLTITGVDGTENVPGADIDDNNYRTVVYQIRQPGGFVKQFVGVPDASGNTPANEYNPGYGWAEGPPSNNLMNSGSINVAPGQTVISALDVRGSSAAAGVDGSAIACDAWDPSLLTLVPGNYPASASGAPGQRYPSNGEAVWLSGQLEADANALHTIQYSTGNGGDGDASTCDSGTWYDSPEDVPGGVSAVSRVRIWVELTAGAQYDINETFFSIALKVSDDATAGAIIPNWAGVLFHFGEKQTQSEMLADSENVWLESTYDPTNHSGSLGDRLIAAPAYSRIVKTVMGPGASDFSDIIPVTTGGDIVQYRLAPTLTSSAATTEVTKAVWVEDCIPAGQIFQSATIAPTTLSTTSPAGAGLTCAPRETYVRWDLGQRVPNTAIEPIVVTVRVSPVASTGTYTNTTLVSAEDDFSTVAQRDDTAQIRITQPSGVKIDKVPLTPVVEVNRTEEVNKDPLQWRIDLANIQAPGVLSDPDVIDVLPKNGLNGTSFTGTLAFGTATVIDGGDDVEVLYTSASTIAEDPSDPSNGATGSTVWCDAPGGNVVSGAGTSADCPAAAEDVSGLRVVRDGPFAAGDLISVELTMIPTGNSGGDVYVNRTFARVDGLVLPVGPVDAPENVLASSVGDFVWNDLNSNGIQDAGEPSVAGVPVSISGTDSDGNTVSATTVTDANGNYLFAGLASGTYVVTFDPDWVDSHGFEFTLKSQGIDPLVDSNADTTTGASDPIILGVDETRLDIDAGLIQFLGGLTIIKDLAGAGTSLATGPFEFEVVCTNLGSTVYEGTVVLERTGDETTLESERIGSIPVGSSCVVTETGTGGADTTPPAVTVVIVQNENNNTVTAGFVNEFSAGTISVAKVLAGTDAESDAVKAKVFTILVTCQVEVTGLEKPVTVFSGVVTIRGGQTSTAVDSNGETILLPLGSVCFAAETDNGGANSSVVDHDSFDNGVTVVSGTPDDLQPLLITATNTFDKGTTPPVTDPPVVTPPVVTPPVVTPPVTDPPVTKTNDPLASTGVSWTSTLGLIALPLVLSGLVLLMFRRRRREV